MATDILSTDDFGQDQQQVLDAFADLIELAHAVHGATTNGSTTRQILEAAHEAYDTLNGILSDEMVGGRPIADLPTLCEDSVALFCDQCIALTEEEAPAVTAADLYEAYRLFCHSRRLVPSGQTVFGARLDTAGFAKIRKIRSRNYSYQGIRLVQEQP